MESAIYSRMDRDAAFECGYFHTKEEFSPIHAYPWKRNLITREDKILFYPGSFGTFHEGHLSVCKRALQEHPDAVLVLAPSNSDYLVEKYGAWSEYSSNLARYRNLINARAKLRMAGFENQVFIDIDPMLNHRCDQNFTDQLLDFLQRGDDIRGFADMETPPVIIAGKDRKNFLGLNDHTSLIKVKWYDDTTGASTSKLENPQRQRAELILRCNHKEEYELFCSHFYDQYTSIKPFYIKDELKQAMAKAKEVGATHTICKEYKDFLEYIPVHRTYKNPLVFTDIEGVHHIKEGMVILDSDIFSGTTFEAVKKRGAQLHALIDLRHKLRTHELLDISDFRKWDWCYPVVDISSRCSMQAFDFDFHKRFDAFKEALSHV